MFSKKGLFLTKIVKKEQSEKSFQNFVRRKGVIYKKSKIMLKKG